MVVRNSMISQLGGLFSPPQWRRIWVHQGK